MRSLKTLKNLSDLLSPVKRWKNDLWGKHKKQGAVCLVYVLFMLQHPKPVMFSLFILENISKQKFFQGISHLEIPKSYSTM